MASIDCWPVAQVQKWCLQTLERCSEPLKSQISQVIESEQIDGEVLASLCDDGEDVFVGTIFGSKISTVNGRHETDVADELAGVILFRKASRLNKEYQTHCASTDEVHGWFQHYLFLTSDKTVSDESRNAVLDVIRKAGLDGDAVAALVNRQVSMLLPPSRRALEGASLVRLLEEPLLEVHYLLKHEAVGRRVVRKDRPVELPVLEALPLPPPNGAQRRTIVVLGNTGAGKSTLLNAVLGEVGVLPTNAMRACTAAIIELEYNHNQTPAERYAVEVEFVSAAEWAEEVSAMARALGPDLERGQAPREDTPAHDALCKLRSAYGAEATAGLATAADVEALAKRPGAIANHLGRTLSMRAANGTTLRDMYCHVVDSADSSAEGALWPAVRRVTLRGPWALLCGGDGSGGVRLVDAPGLADDNGARGNLVRGCLRGADGVWLVSNIRRAVNDKTVKELLTLEFRQALLHACASASGSQRGSSCGARIGGVGEAIAATTAAIGGLAFVATHTDVLVRSEVIENLDLTEEASLLECALARNEFTKRRIRADFLQGLDLVSHPTTLANPAVASEGGNWWEKAHAAPGGPTPFAAAAGLGSSGSSGGVSSNSAVVSGIDTKFEVPVYTVSAVEFQKVSGVRTEDGPPCVFADAADTEIPALRAFVRATAMRKGRPAAAIGEAQQGDGFRTGAELLRGLEEARRRAQEEELMVTSEAVEDRAGMTSIGSSSSSISKDIASTLSKSAPHMPSIPAKRKKVSVPSRSMSWAERRLLELYHASEAAKRTNRIDAMVASTSAKSSSASSAGRQAVPAAAGARSALQAVRSAPAASVVIDLTGDD